MSEEKMVKVPVWYVENEDGNGKRVVKYFATYEEARAYAEWTLGKIGKCDGI